jgi:hypothetical protein
MEQISLELGRFCPLFNYLTSHMEQLDYVHVDTLWQCRLICFDARGKPHYPIFFRC